MTNPPNLINFSLGCSVWSVDITSQRSSDTVCIWRELILTLLSSHRTKKIFSRIHIGCIVIFELAKLGFSHEIRCTRKKTPLKKIQQDKTKIYSPMNNCTWMIHQATHQKQAKWSEKEVGKVRGDAFCLVRSYLCKAKSPTKQRQRNALVPCLIDKINNRKNFWFVCVIRSTKKTNWLFVKLYEFLRAWLFLPFFG